MNEEEKTLNLDDVKFLLEKIHAAQQAGNHVIFRHSNYSTEVIAMEGEISEEKEWDKQFYMHNNAPEEQKATYNECILYLEKLAGEILIHASARDATVNALIIALESQF